MTEEVLLETLKAIPPLHSGWRIDREAFVDKTLWKLHFDEVEVTVQIRAGFVHVSLYGYGGGPGLLATTPEEVQTALKALTMNSNLRR